MRRGNVRKVKKIELFPWAFATLLLVAPGAALAAPASTASPAAQPPSTPPQPTSQAIKAPGYRVGPRDLLDVRVFEMPELTGTRRVSEDGTISLPPLADLQIAGLTEAEVAQKL